MRINAFTLVLEGKNQTPLRMDANGIRSQGAQPGASEEGS